MKPVEFIRKFGWGKAIEHLKKMDAENWHNGFFNDLKTYVEAYELVDSYAGLHGFKTYCNGEFTEDELKAIQLVEEVESE